MIARILSAMLALAFVVLTFFFASLIVATAVAAGLLFWAWAWWRNRGRIRSRRGDVIEGEYRIIESK